MKVYEIMTIDVGFCSLGDDLSKAAAIMWDKDCGIVPVVDAEMRVVGVITDRDIAITAASQNRRPSEILAAEMLFRPVECCAMEDPIGSVLKRMSKLQVRRLPVIGERGELLGIISIADILRKAGKKAAKRAAKALQDISGRRDCSGCSEN
ncbi:MAG: CBS domain-containing protein [Acidobacteria bacterium]|nr:CBS domain-containing protein [Acidobacteriota bacterium]MBK8148398.1 CBS domain-containing protein [Acidobacteriota bacterium]MBK8813319.1 CBS domain-containing protein [Acidobacteriota bacterium]